MKEADQAIENIDMFYMKNNYIVCAKICAKGVV